MIIEAMEFILGLILGFFGGLFLTLFSVSVGLKNSEKVEGVARRGYVKPSDFKKGEAEFFDPGDTEMDAIEKVVSENDARGRDTKMEDL